MREIRFRGKSTLGKWISGLLFAECVIRDSDNHIHYCDDYTIGQFTGMYDKNGKEIYEGDIVEAWSEGRKAIGEVKARKDGLWLIYPAWQNGEFWTFCPNDNGQDMVEVIGNIHDNPELLKG